MSRIHLFVIMTLAFSLPSVFVLANQFPQCKKNLERYRQSVLKQIADYLPKPERKPCVAPG